MKSLQLVLYVLVVFMCHASDKEKKTKVHNRHHKYSWSTDELVRFFDIDTSKVKTLISTGIFRPDDTCTGFVHIKKSKDKLQRIRISQNDPLEQQLLKLCALLYTNVHQNYTDTGLTDVPFQITERRLKQDIIAANNGEFTVMCGEYALFVQYFLKIILPNVRTNIVSMNVPAGYGIDHTVCIVYTPTNKAIVVDPMFGYIYSYNINDSTAGEVLFLPEKILRKKRFLTNRIWPCNFTYPDAAYYFAPKKSNFKYELQQKLDIEIFFPPQYSLVDYQRDLKRLCNENKNLISPFPNEKRKKGRKLIA
jgi:hypothetical protein